MVTITDPAGNTIAWSSSGVLGFKGSRKSTPFAAQLAAEDAVKKAQEHGIRNLEVTVKGPGAGREAALRALGGTGVQVSVIKDVTPIPTTAAARPSVAGFRALKRVSGGYILARYRGSVCRLCRREVQKLYLKGDRCFSEKCAVERRAYPPGSTARDAPR